MLRLFFCGFLVLTMSVPAFSGMVNFSAAGADAASIAATVDVFRAVLGTPNNGNAPGPLVSGRREINWDEPEIPFLMPGNFFNTPPTTRGAGFFTPGTGFGVSNSAIPLDDEFDSFNPNYPGQFTTFSSPRLFAPLGSNVVEMFFFIPGSTTPTTVVGFGAVFTDVDLPDSTQLLFYDQNSNLLGGIAVPVFSQGLSFVGGFFNAGEQIFRVRIFCGNSPLGPDETLGVDVVAMDDFFYSEPRAVVPLPGTLLLLGSGCLGLVVSWRRYEPR